MHCEILGIDIKNKKAQLKCNGITEAIDFSGSDCQIIQQGKDPLQVVEVRCDGKS